MSEEVPVPTIKTLFAHSNNECAMDECNLKLTDPSWPSVRARIAHIRAQRPTGARYDASYPDVHAYENLILLCPNHHNLVDDLEPDAWPVERLLEMKARHENGPGSGRHWATDQDYERFAVEAIRVTYAVVNRGDQVTAAGTVGSAHNAGVAIEAAAETATVHVTAHDSGSGAEGSERIEEKPAPAPLPPAQTRPTGGTAGAAAAAARQRRGRTVTPPPIVSPGQGLGDEQR